MDVPGAKSAMENQDLESNSEPQETVEAIKESFPEKKTSINLLMHFLTFLGGVLISGLWVKFIFACRYDVEWHLEAFRDPKILVTTSVFFFLMGVGMVYGVRHIVTWLKECRTY
jgi:hypothetical protein